MPAAQSSSSSVSSSQTGTQSSVGLPNASTQGYIYLPEHSECQADEQSFPHWLHTTIRSGLAWARVACNWTHRSGSRGGCFGRWRRCCSSLAILDYTTSADSDRERNSLDEYYNGLFSCFSHVIYANDTLGSGSDTGVFSVRRPGRWERRLL